MAVLHRKEEKIQAVLGRLPKKYNADDFVAMFIKLYSKDWGKIKSAYIKASQDREPGTVIHMPKPDLYLKQVLEIFLSQKTETTALPKETQLEPEVITPKIIDGDPIVVPKKAKIAKSKPVVKETPEANEEAKKKPKAVAKKTPIANEEATKKPKVVAKKKID